MHQLVTIRGVLVATDGSANARRAEAVASAIAASCKCKLVVFTSSRGLLSDDLRRLAHLEGDVSAARRVLIEQILESAAERAKQAGVSDVRAISRHGDPAATIVSTAEAEGTDLIVMGRRGIGVLSELLVGSVSRTVVNKAHCPVTVVP
ncbi:universal stress protein [Bradyrhizobium sp. LHD-71]|uniref:universal stress protein n=1 Tax=Bradyrhizobium sp. LHD-71 TaxID=3072141 RepID=UPI00280DEB53|nr:universal stress protein [Bradyrhizobium sp. LHD-71]MDQ8727195.1 universal stress protein [Bradyrhizobium sp. LHD-71]